MINIPDFALYVQGVYQMHSGGGWRMNEQDRRAVENMCLTGMEPEGLYACFPSFSREEIDKIYKTVKGKPGDGTEDNVISVNCS